MSYRTGSQSYNQSSTARRSMESAQSQEADDMVASTNRKAKKREQNRLAQRTYRHRTRMRLEELEQQVHDYEQQNLSHTATNDKLDTISQLHHGQVAAQNSSSFLDSQTSSTFQTQQSSYCTPQPSRHNSYPYESVHQNVLSRQLSLEDGADHHRQMPLDSRSIYQPSAQNGAAMADHQPFPQDYLTTNFASPSTQQDFMHTYQQDLTNGCISGSALFAEDWSFENYPSFKGVLSPQKATAKSRARDLDLMQIDNRSDMGITPSTTSESYVSSDSECPSLAKTSRSTSASSVAEEEQITALQPPGPKASMEERIDFMLSCAKSAGFDGFEPLTTEYYTQQFNQASNLSSEQRISRRRRLPQMLAELRQQSANWTQWERSGFEDEILRAAEGVCADECNRFVGMDKHAAQSFMAMLEADSQRVTQTTFQEELPHLWLLLASLSSNNNPMSHGDRFKVVSASMLITCFWGRIPPQKIMSWLNTYLVGSS